MWNLKKEADMQQITDFLSLAKEVQALKDENTRLQNELREANAYLFGMLCCKEGNLYYRSPDYNLEKGFINGMDNLIERRRLSYHEGQYRIFLSINGKQLTGNVWGKLKEMFPDDFSK